MAKAVHFELYPEQSPQSKSVSDSFVFRFCSDSPACVSDKRRNIFRAAISSARMPCTVRRDLQMARIIWERPLKVIIVMTCSYLIIPYFEKRLLSNDKFYQSLVQINSFGMKIDLEHVLHENLNDIVNPLAQLNRRQGCAPYLEQKYPRSPTAFCYFSTAYTVTELTKWHGLFFDTQRCRNVQTFKYKFSRSCFYILFLGGVLKGR